MQEHFCTKTADSDPLSCGLYKVFEDLRLVSSDDLSVAHGQSPVIVTTEVDQFIPVNSMVIPEAPAVFALGEEWRNCDGLGAVLAGLLELAQAFCFRRKNSFFPDIALLAAPHFVRQDASSPRIGLCAVPEDHQLSKLKHPFHTFGPMFGYYELEWVALQWMSQQDGVVS
jgi:hypothetical protein